MRPFADFKKNYTYKSEKNLAQFLAYHLFQILKKVHLQILKKHGGIFGRSSFQIFRKTKLTNPKKTSASFFLISFLNIKKCVFKNFKKNVAQFFAYKLFQILKKVYLQIFKTTWSKFLLITFFKY